MDFLNTAYAQLSDLFRSMTVGARITAGLLLAVVVISLAWLFQHQVTGGNTELFGGQAFSASELNAMEAAFSQAGLSGYEVDGSRIRIPRQQQAAYVAALADAKALPAHWNQFLGRALESNSPFITQKEREDRLRIATQQELSLVLTKMKDVANATVHYDSQKKSGFGTQRVATASVIIEMVGSRTLDEPKVQMIREMVAGCFADLDPDKVKVSDLNGRVFSVPGGDGLGGSGGNHRYVTTKAAFEKQYEQSIQEALAYVPGVTVAVNVELEKQLRTSTHTMKHDPKTAAVGVREESTTIKSESAPRGGSPGLTQQGPQPNQSVRLSESAKGSTNEEERTSREERNVVNSESTEVESIGLTPRRVTVSVGVPDGYFEDVWRRRNPPPDGQPQQPPDPQALANIEKDEIKRIQDHVVPLIPKPSDVLDPTPLVTVTRFTTIPEAAIPAPGVASQAMGWFGENWQTLGLVGLVAASLLMVRSIVRTAPPESKGLEIPLPATAPAAEDKPKTEVAGETAKSRLKRRATSGRSLRDDLTDMVREDPDTAANILRGWIGSGN
jgi:flagellar M-ring protein FliF